MSDIQAGMRDSLPRLIFRSVLPVILGTFIFFAIPIYSEPFGGCDRLPVSDWAWGCWQHWLEFFRGAAFVLLLALASLKKHWVGLLALIMMFVIGIMGGAYNFFSGQLLFSPGEALVFIDYALILGGVAGFVVYLAFCKLLRSLSRCPTAVG